MDECVFCQIAAKESPSHLFYDDGKYIGILPLESMNRGHVMVIPRAHYRWVWDSDDISGYFRVVQRVAAALKAAFQTDWVMGVQVGDEVPHAHVHLIPRYPDDGHGSFLEPSQAQRLTDSEKEELVVMIRQSLKRDE